MLRGRESRRKGGMQRTLIFSTLTSLVAQRVRQWMKTSYSHIIALRESFDPVK